MNQCKACPWKKSTKPERDIPGGYSEEKHQDLSCTIAEPGTFRPGPTSMMACHETPVGKERPCVGWVMHQLGPGNNLGLRMLAMDGRFRDMKLDGPQHERFEDTLPKTNRARKKSKSSEWVKCSHCGCLVLPGTFCAGCFENERKQGK